MTRPGLSPVALHGAAFMHTRHQPRTVFSLAHGLTPSPCRTACTAMHTAAPPLPHIATASSACHM